MFHSGSLLIGIAFWRPHVLSAARVSSVVRPAYLVALLFDLRLHLLTACCKMAQTLTNDGASL
jgi:hypothetical protein